MAAGFQGYPIYFYNSWLWISTEVEARSTSHYLYFHHSVLTAVLFLYSFDIVLKIFELGPRGSQDWTQWYIDLHNVWSQLYFYQ